MSFAPTSAAATCYPGQRWRMRLVFWGGAVAVGLVSVAFAWASNRATGTFHHLLIHPGLAFVLTPGTFVLSETWLARRFFPGSQGSGIPQAIAARRARHRRDALLSVRLTLGRLRSPCWGWPGGASIGRRGPYPIAGGRCDYAEMRSVGRHGQGARPDFGWIGSGRCGRLQHTARWDVFAIEEMGRAFEQKSSALVLIAVILCGYRQPGPSGQLQLLRQQHFYADRDDRLGGSVCLWRCRRRPGRLLCPRGGLRQRPPANLDGANAHATP